MRLATVFLVFLLSAPALSQYTVKTVAFSDLGSYSQADLEGAAGVHAGQSLTTAELSAAAQRLSDTGAFDDIDATLDGSMKAVTVKFRLKPLKSESLLRAGFENFAWFTPTELQTAVHSRVSLFHGFLPAAGNLPDAVAHALEEALAARGVHATVSYEVVEPSTGHPQRIFEFKAGPRPVVVGTVMLNGYPPALAKAGTEVQAALKGAPYNEGLRGQTTEASLLQPLLDAGLLEAHLTGVSRTVTDKPDGIEIDLTGMVVPGSPYRVASIAYAGGPLMTADAFAHPAANLADTALHPLKVGDLASASALMATLEPLRDVYLAHGYLDAVVDAHPQLDRDAGTVAYTVGVVPGEVYRLRSVRPVNLSAAALADFQRGWLLKPGDVYNAEYVSSFLKRNTALQALQGYSAVFDTKADPEQHMVDLTINFMRGKTAR